MKLVTRRAKFKLDQEQEAVGGDGIRDCFPPPPPHPSFSSALFFPRSNKTMPFRTRNVQNNFSSKQILPMTITFFVYKLLLVEE